MQKTARCDVSAGAAHHTTPYTLQLYLLGKAGGTKIYLPPPCVLGAQEMEGKQGPNHPLGSTSNLEHGVEMEDPPLVRKRAPRSRAHSHRPHTHFFPLLLHLLYAYRFIPVYRYILYVVGSSVPTTPPEIYCEQLWFLTPSRTKPHNGVLRPSKNFVETPTPPVSMKFGRDCCRF